MTDDMILLYKELSTNFYKDLDRLIMRSIIFKLCIQMFNMDNKIIRNNECI